MRLLRFSLAILWTILGVTASRAGDCRGEALARLRAGSPEGWAIYRQTREPGFFASWIDCAASQYDLPTAVHESTHVVSAERDAFPLVGGGSVARPHEVTAFFAPAAIAARFEPDDFTAIYLTRGKASSAEDFLYLLDEMNAYAHDLAAAVDLEALSSPDWAIDHRDGLAATMAFVAAYADQARAGEPATWNALRQPETAGAVATLWERAERVMAGSCGIPNFGTRDTLYIRDVCAAGPRSALAQVLGRAPACPAACLEPPAETAASEASASDRSAPEALGEASGSEALDTDATATIPGNPEPYGPETTMPARPRHPFSGNAGPRRHSLRDTGE